MGFCLYGNDIDEQTSPIAAGLGWVTHLTDGRDFIDREILERQMKEGVAERLKGIVLLEQGIPRSGYLLVNEAGEEVGRSEERRVGKECRWRWSRDQYRK